MFDFLLGRRDRPQPPAQRRRVAAEWPAVVYAIGDVHGCYDLLQDLLNQIRADAARTAGSKLLVMLGDYVDRGPKSASVLDWLCAPPPDGFDRVALAGNHEVLMLDFLADPRPDASWLGFGGTETLASYGIDLEQFTRARPRDRTAMLDAFIPVEHLDLLRSLPGMLTLPHATFVHAGLRSGLPLADQHDDDLLWMREPFLSEEMPADMFVVHGHTPAAEPVVAGRRICVDTGAFATGTLTAVRMDGTDIRFLQTRAHSSQAGTVPARDN
jgi:serine/threonine protein phosphatase 1